MNNLSYPAVFAEGVGITGLSDATADPSTPPDQQTWTGLRIPSPANPTLGTAAGDTYVDPATGITYYLQARDGSSWQAGWKDAKGMPPVQADVTWGDNLLGTLLPSSGQGHGWAVTSTIHIEVALKSLSPTDAGVYFPTSVLSGHGSNEVFGTTGVATPAAGLRPNVYSDAAYLTIQKLDTTGAPVGAPIHTAVDWNHASEGPGSLAAEVNAAGNVVFSYNWFAGQDSLTPGTYRLTFGVVTGSGDPSLSPPTPGNAQIAAVVAPSGTEGVPGQSVSCGTPIEVSGTTIPLTCGTNGAGTFSSLDLTLAASGSGGGGGPPASEATKNLSNPAVFAEGIGITGLSDSTADPAAAPDQQSWTGLRIPSPTNPTLGTGAGDTYTGPGGTLYYLQGTAGSSWQATWRDGKGAPPVDADVKWGDNLLGTLLPSSGKGHTWSVTSTIHVEVALRATSPMGEGSYFPTSALYGSGESEVFGTTGVATPATDQLPTVYSDAAYLTIQKLDAAGNPVGAPIHSLIDWNHAAEGPGSLAAEVNASGTIVYGYNWFAGQDNLTPGTYRLTFGIVTGSGDPSLTPPTPGNARIAGVVAPSDTEGVPGLPASCGSPVQVSGVTIPLTCGTNGAGTFSSVDLTLAASGSGGGGGTVSTPDHLATSSSTLSTTAGTLVAEPIAVSILDAAGDVVTSDSTTQVDLGLVSPPAGVTLTCADPASLQATASSGIATFTGCSIDQPGTYVLEASVPATSPAPPATSRSVQMSWTVAPSTSGGGGGGTSPPAGPPAGPPAPPVSGPNVTAGGLPSAGAGGAGAPSTGAPSTPPGTGSIGAGTGAGSAGSVSGTGPPPISRQLAAARLSRHRALVQLNTAIATTNASIHKYHAASLRALQQHLSIQPELAANVQRLEVRLHELLQRRQALVASIARLYR